MLHWLILDVCVLQEMEKLKEELEHMNDLMEQKDTLTQKLEVCIALHKENIVFSKTYSLRIFLPFDETSLPANVICSPGDRAAQPGAGGATVGGRAAAGGEPGRAGEFQEESPDTFGVAGWQDL